ncbi:MAG: 6-carboxytetrahydropterin synthase [Chloroflexi bacterium]|nr:6-carboxytetrahydropterin synthase [Chloroflexota bacterium]
MYQLRVEVIFDSGHRLLNYQGKCAYPHGHTYKAEIFIGSSTLNEMGMVSDFLALKERIKGWLEENWDHAFLVNSRDKELLNALGSLTLRRLYVFQEQNPSCEVMAREIYQKAQELGSLAPSKVRLWESPTQYAEYCGGE